MQDRPNITYYGVKLRPEMQLQIAVVQLILPPGEPKGKTISAIYQNTLVVVIMDACLWLQELSEVRRQLYRTTNDMHDIVASALTEKVCDVFACYVMTTLLSRLCV